MFGRFAFFLVVVLCASQAYSLKPEERAISDIIQGIKDIIAKIENAISDVISKIPNLIKDIKQKIEDIINKIDIPGIVQKIQDKINKIIEDAGVTASAAKKCIEKEKSEVEQLVKETTDAVAKCRQNAIDRTAQLEGEMDELKIKSKALIAEIKSGAQQCIKDNGLNPIKLLKCMTTHFADISAKADAFVKQVADTVITASKTAGDITVTLAKCTANITTNVLSGEKKIIVNFTKCVDDIKNN